MTSDINNGALHLILQLAKPLTGITISLNLQECETKQSYITCNDTTKNG